MPLERGACDLGGFQQLVRGDDEPQGGVDSVELRRLPAFRKAVGQHAARDRGRPLEQDLPRQVEAPGRQAEAAKGDEGVPAPVGEPRIAGDDRRAVAAPDQIGVGGAFERGGKGRAPPPLVLQDVLDRRARIGRRRFVVRRQPPERVACRQVEGDRAGRPQVLAIVQAALALGDVQEVSVPDRVVRVEAVRAAHDPGQALVRAPGDQVPVDGRIGAAVGVLAVQRVIVAPGQQGPHHQPHGRLRRRLHDPPGDDRGRLPARHDDLVEDAHARRKVELPGRPGLVGERGDARGAVGIDDAGRIALRAQRVAPAVDVRPRVEAVDQHHPPGRRPGGRQQQRVVAACPDEAGRARRKSSQAIGLQILALVVACHRRHSWAAQRPACIIVRRPHSPAGRRQGPGGDRVPVAGAI